MRVLLVSQYYPPEIGATQNRMSEFVRGLRARGHDVDVLTEVPNHPTGVIAPEYRRGWRFVERAADGSRVVRVWVAASAKKTFGRRLAFYGSFFAASLAAATRLPTHYHVVAATSPPLPAAAAGLALSRWKQARFVLDVRDLWPKAAKALGELSNRHAYWAAERLERKLYRSAARITATTQAFCSYIGTHGGDPARIVHIANGTRLDLFEPSRPKAAPAGMGGQREMVVGYVGLHGIAQGLDTLLDAAALLREHPVRWMFVGEGPIKNRLITRAKAQGLSKVHFFPAIPLSECASWLNVADVVVVPLAADKTFDAFVPSKLFDAMACARPVLLSVNGEARHILETAGAGRFVTAGDPRALCDAVLALNGDPDAREAMGRRGRAFVERHYSREEQAARFADTVEAAADEEPSCAE